MTPYLLGNLLGRAFVTWLIILLVLFIVSRFDFKLAFRRGTRWYVWLAVFLLAGLGLAVRALRMGSA
jgi:hypothetical protein